MSELQPTVHLAGVPRENCQRCARCGAMLCDYRDRAHLPPRWFKPRAEVLVERLPDGITKERRLDPFEEIPDGAVICRPCERLTEAQTGLLVESFEEAYATPNANAAAGAGIVAVRLLAAEIRALWADVGRLTAEVNAERALADRRAEQVTELAAALETALKALDRVRPQTTGVLVIQDVDHAIADSLAVLEAEAERVRQAEEEG